jgi:hypothetical protein
MFSPNQSTFLSKRYFVPDDYVFLPYVANCTVTELKASIGTGTQTLVLAMDTTRIVDWSDDWKLGLCGSNTSAQAEQARYEQANADNLFHLLADTKANLYSRVDGKDLPYFYIYDNGTYFFEECPGKELCGPDDCDSPKLDTCKGLDAFPLMGWFATDTRTWRNGDTRTYEYGVTNRPGTQTEPCSRTKFIVTAKGRNKCNGIFGLGFGLDFCPFSWLFYLLSRV